MNAHITCSQVLEQIYVLIDCEECSERTALIDSGNVPGPDARVRALMREHVHSCDHCTDALDAERHLRSLLRQCYASQEAPQSLRTRIAASITTVTLTR